jgi:hypothetical protein
MIESVDLSIWTDEGENVEISLEPWQVKAIIYLLGIKVEPSFEQIGAYDVKMFGPQTVKMLLDALQSRPKQTRKAPSKTSSVPLNDVNSTIEGKK